MSSTSSETMQDTPASINAERPSKKVKFSQQVSVGEFLATPAKEAVVFHLLYGTTADQLEAEMQAGGCTFSCEYYNQVFGDSEEINGYKGLEVDIWIALRSGHCWVDIKYQDAQPSADNIKELLAEWWPQPFTTNRSEFLQAAAAASNPDWPSMGRMLDSSMSSSVCSAEGDLQLYHAPLEDTPAWFKELHARLEPLLIFTIDGANFIDASDPKWEVVAAVAQHNGHRYMVGFMMLYNFYAWPMSKRPRVAQVLIIPPMQRRGYGRALIAAAYHVARQRDAVDLTFEDPAASLQLLREKLELEMMDACDWLQRPAVAAVQAAEAQERLWSNSQQPGAASPGADPGTVSCPTAAAAVVQNGPQAGSHNHKTAGAVAADATPLASAAHCLVMPRDLQRRVVRELKIHKAQVLCVWEALLYLHSDVCSSSAAAEAGTDAGRGKGLLLKPLTELITTRLEKGAAAPADKAAAKKKLVQVQGSEEDWFVYKLPKTEQQQQQVLPGGGDGVEDTTCPTISVGRHTITTVSADDYSSRLQEQVSQRLDTLALLKRRFVPQRSDPTPQAFVAAEVV